MATTVSVFVSHPSDVTAERNRLASVIEELDRTIGEANQINLRLIDWETHVRPGMALPGQDIQDYIFSQLDPYDILIGIMGQRFGTPTRTAGSGSEAEFRQAFELFVDRGKPNIMLYFQETMTIRLRSEVPQAEKVLQFRDEVQQKGITKDFSSVEDFETKVRQHLTMELQEIIKKRRQQRSRPAKIVGTTMRGIRLADAVKTAGLVDIESRDNEEHSLPPIEFMNAANREIAFSTISGANTFHHRLPNVIDILAKGVKIHLLILHPDSPDLIRLSDVHSRDLRSDVLQVVESIKRNSLHRNGLTVRFRDNLPPFLSVMIDGDINPIGGAPVDIDGQVRVQPVTMHRVLHAGAVIHFAKQSVGIFDFFAEDLREQWRIDGRELSEFLD